jgi:GDPmannose 4,6-dehydratase
MLQQDVADDYVIATGVTTSVKEFAEIAFSHAGLRASDYVKVDPSRLRPAEVDVLLGDPSKAEQKIGWKAEVTLAELAAEMVDADIARHSANH